MRKSHAPDLSSTALEQAALRYLERFAASAEQLRRVLRRRVRRAQILGVAESEAALPRIEALIERYLAAGLLDDRRFAEGKAASLQRRGSSRRRIRQHLAATGVDAEITQDIVEALSNDGADGELAAAAALVRRRRLGPYRPVSARADHRQKDLATLARAGFPLELARRVLRAESPEALEAMVRGVEE